MFTGVGSNSNDMFRHFYDGTIPSLSFVNLHDLRPQGFTTLTLEGSLATQHEVNSTKRVKLWKVSILEWPMAHLRHLSRPLMRWLMCWLALILTDCIEDDDDDADAVAASEWEKERERCVMEEWTLAKRSF